MKKRYCANEFRFGVFLMLFFCIQIPNAFSQAPMNDQWIDLDENEDYVARHECSFVQCGNAFIMFGGRESAQRLDTYQFTTDTWSQGSAAPKQFNHFQATAYQGFVWVIGAFKTNNFPKEVPEENIWLYYPPGDVWIMGPEIPEARRRGGAGLVVHKDKFYLLGGNTIGHDGGFVDWFDEYDPQTGQWTQLENASTPRDHFYAAVIGTTLYAAGGRKSGGVGGVFAPVISVVDAYDFEAKSWKQIAEIPTPRAAPAVAVLDNRMFVMGGEGELQGSAFKITETYDPETGLWSRGADMNYPRHGTQAIQSGEGIFVAGGSPKRGGGNQHNMEVYNLNQPAGEALVASSLTAPEKVAVAKGKRASIPLKVSGGNTGVFISSFAITGLNADSFQLMAGSKRVLVKQDSAISIEVKHLGRRSKEDALLEIVYNGNVKLQVLLTSK